MPTLKDLPIRPPKVLLYGKAGSGKTPFVTSYGDGMLFIDCDQGLSSARKLQDNWTEARQKVEIYECLEEDPMKAAAWRKAREKVAEVYSQFTKGKAPCKVLAIDSFTTVADFAKRSILANSNKNINASGQMNLQLWGLVIDELDNMFVFLKAIPVPVIVVFHTRETTQGSGTDEVTYEEISIFGKNLPAKITSYFGEIWKQKVRIVGGKMEPRLQTVSDAHTVARSRDGLTDGTLTSVGMLDCLGKLGWK